MLPKLVYKYTYNDEIKSKLSYVLIKKVKTFFPKTHYNDVITSGNKEYIKEHYINKFYRNLKILNVTDVLNDDELMMLSNEVVSNFYNNYLNGDKKSGVANYFNSQINKKLKYFSNEEKFLLYYVNKIGLNNKMVLYFINKYRYLLEEFRDINFNTYKKIIKDILSSDISFKNLKFESLIIKYIKNKQKSYRNYIIECEYSLRNGSMLYYDEVKKYYSYIIDLVYNNYKNKVIFNKKEFKKSLEEKYEIYFKETINNMSSNKQVSIQKKC